MKQVDKAYLYLIAASMQSVWIFIFAFEGGKWLDLHYPHDFRWRNVTLVFALAVVVHMFYSVMKIIVRDMGLKK